MENDLTGYNIFCGGPVHQERHELVMFSRPALIAYPIFVQEAETAGWSYSEPRRRWLCPECASDSTRARED